jgi:hypothetical protein
MIKTQPTLLAIQPSALIAQHCCRICWSRHVFQNHINTSCGCVALALGCEGVFRMHSVKDNTTKRLAIAQ